jgi:hypothetical protein
MARRIQTHVARIPRVRSPKAVKPPRPVKPPKDVTLPGYSMGRTSNRSPRAGAHVHHHHATPKAKHLHATPKHALKRHAHKPHH